MVQPAAPGGSYAIHWSEKLARLHLARIAELPAPVRHRPDGWPFRASSNAPLPVSGWFGGWGDLKSSVGLLLLTALSSAARLREVLTWAASIRDAPTTSWEPHWPPWTFEQPLVAAPAGRVRITRAARMAARTAASGTTRLRMAWRVIARASRRCRSSRASASTVTNVGMPGPGTVHRSGLILPHAVGFGVLSERCCRPLPEGPSQLRTVIRLMLGRSARC